MSVFSLPCEILWRSENKLMCLRAFFGNIALLNDTLLNMENSRAVCLWCGSCVYVMKFYWIFMGFAGNISTLPIMFTMFHLKSERISAISVCCCILYEKSQLSCCKFNQLNFLQTVQMKTWKSIAQCSWNNPRYIASICFQLQVPR